MRRRKRRIACHRWVCWWAWSPILELQTRDQLSHGQALRLLRGWTPFRTALLCSRASARESSNWVTASWHRVLQAERSWVSPPRADGSMPHCFKLTSRASLYRKTGPHCRRFPDASCPRNTYFGIRLSGIRIIWPTQRSCALSRKASMPIIPLVFNTSVLGILSCGLTRAILRRQRRWN